MNNQDLIDRRRLADVLLVAINELREATGRPELQAQTVATFLTFAASAQPLSVLELMEHVGYERSSASRNVDMLADGLKDRCTGIGLLQKTRDPCDGRRCVVQLSEKGEAVMSRIVERTGPLIARMATNARTGVK